ncbi:MAG TPA: DUF1080 domain-containing protein [Actinomycetota bacterium]|nr:DUF1080 domain-containing protein [Actinomycetota bacterium]
MNHSSQTLFDGRSLAGWQMSTIRGGKDDPGHFEVVDGVLEAVPGNDIGLLWHTEPAPADFQLSVEWLSTRRDDNSGVFVRFPNPESRGYEATAWVAVDFGFEIQIDDLARPDGDPAHKTAAVYEQQAPDRPEHLPVKPLGEWNRFDIRVAGQTYDITLNGVPVTHFVNRDSGRGVPSRPGEPSYVGIQAHTGRVRFRNVVLVPL